jgi:hypothetical protein
MPINRSKSDLPELSCEAERSASCGSEPLPRSAKPIDYLQEAPQELTSPDQLQRSTSDLVRVILERGYAIGVGRPKSPSADHVIILPREWRYLDLNAHGYKNYIARSSVDATVYYDIRFFPLDHPAAPRLREVAPTNERSGAEAIRAPENERVSADLTFPASEHEPYRRSQLLKNATQTDYAWQALGELTSDHPDLVQLEAPVTASPAAWARAIIKRAEANASEDGRTMKIAMSNVLSNVLDKAEAAKMIKKRVDR